MIDRHGKLRFYFRRGKGARVALPGPYGSPEFLAAYQAALARAPVPTAKPKVAGTPGTFRRLYSEYLGSPDFLRNKASTQRQTRGILDPFMQVHGDRLVHQMRRQHVSKIIGDKAGTPAAANNLLKKLRVLMNFAIHMGWCSDDPTKGVKKFREGTYHTWSEAEIAQFEERWPLGTLQRTAFALALFTGQRRHDVARMTWRDYDPASQKIRVVQEKTQVSLQIPAHRDLHAILTSWPKRHVTILTTSHGKPFSVEGFGNFMADAIEGAGLPEQCVLHGLRKAAARRLAEAGCTTHEIASITGHKSLSEIERYTRAASQRTMAETAMARVEQLNGNRIPKPVPEIFPKPRKER